MLFQGCEVFYRILTASGSLFCAVCNVNIEVVDWSFILASDKQKIMSELSSNTQYEQEEWLQQE